MLRSSPAALLNWRSSAETLLKHSYLNLFPLCSLVFSLSLRMLFLILSVTFNSPNVLKIPVISNFFRSSYDKAIPGNVRKISPVCDMLTSYWDQVRRCCAVYLVHCSAGALLLPICFCWPSLNLLSLSFHFSLSILV